MEQKGDGEISLASGHACPTQQLGCGKREGRVLGDVQRAIGYWQPKRNRRWVIALEGFERLYEEVVEIGPLI